MRNAILFIAILLAPLTLLAETVAEMEAPPRQIELGELFYLRFIVVTDDKGEIKIDTKTPAECNEVTRTVKTSIMRRGSISSGRVATYDIYYRANKAGNIEIPQATARVGKISKKTRPGKLSVIAPAQATESEPFMELKLSSHKARVGEPVTATVELYTPTSLATATPLSELKAEHCKVSKLQIDLGAAGTKTIKGRKYHVYRLSRFIITPAASGKISIIPGIYRLLLNGKKYSIAMAPENATLTVTKSKGKSPASGDKVNDETIFI